MSVSYEIQMTLYVSEMKDYAFSYFIIGMDMFIDMHMWHFKIHFKDILTIQAGLPSYALISQELEPYSHSRVWLPIIPLYSFIFILWSGR